MNPVFFYKWHKSLFDAWPHGKIKKSWFDDSGNLCIMYDSGTWFHYKQDASGNIIFW